MSTTNLPGTASRSPEVGAIVPASRTAWLCAGGVMLVFLALTIAESLTLSPWWDEGVFADVALNFRNFGHLGSSVLAPYGYMEWPGIHQYTYWQFPLYLVTLGLWFRLVPTTVVWMRLFSVMWGCIFVISWFVLVRCLSRKDSLALLVASVVALDYSLLVTAPDGRMDMLCAGLGLAGLASYFWFRDSNWSLGVLLAACFGATSLFCHPMGAVTNVAIVAMVLLDWRKIKWGAVVTASIPYLIGVACCLYYIHLAPDIFHAQSGAASQYRVSGLGTILTNILNDWSHRYVLYYYTRYTGISKAKIAALIFPICGTVGLLADSNLRSQPLGRRLLLLLVIGYVGIAVIDNQKFGYYFVLSIPVAAACAAVWLYAQWQKGGKSRVLPSGLLAVSVAATLAGIGYKIHRDEYHNLYNPAVAAIRNYLPPGGLVMGGSELGFALGFGPPLVDDRCLGFLSGKTPDVFAINGTYGPVRFVPRLNNAWESSRTILRNQFHLVFKNEAFSIYVRNDVPRTQASN
jgi:hypothetical protein